MAGSVQGRLTGVQPAPQSQAGLTNTPSSPTATQTLAQATPLSSAAVPLVRVVQLAPLSALVRRMAASPTATQMLLAQATPFRVCVVPLVRAVQLGSVFS
jgi:hypothetical protein